MFQESGNKLKSECEDDVDDVVDDDGAINMDVLLTVRVQVVIRGLRGWTRRGGGRDEEEERR